MSRPKASKQLSVYQIIRSLGKNPSPSIGYRTPSEFFKVICLQMSHHSPTVAVVEDNPIINWQLLRQLTAIGCEVIANYDDVVHAELALPELFPDILISNLKLSDGWVDDCYLNILEGFSMHVIILTGLRDLSLFSKSWHRPNFHYLFKPYSKNQLERCIKALRESEHLYATY